MRKKINATSTPSKRKPKLVDRLMLILSIAGVGIGIYILVLALTPKTPILYPVEPIDISKLGEPKDNRVYIPKIGVNVALLTGGPETLDKGAWHRYPDRGDPLKGGNLIVSAHRFSMGFTPTQTRQKSPFYHIDKLKVDDQIVVDFEGKRYDYKITAGKSVKPTQTEIEEPSKTPKLTLYTCTLKGESDGREVFIAKPIGEVKKPSEQEQ